MAAAGRNDHHRYVQQHHDSAYTSNNNSYASSHNEYPLSRSISPLLPSQRLTKLQADDRDARNDLNHSLVSPIMSRSPSIASDSRVSALSGATSTYPGNPTNVQPAAAYVAPFGAVQVVTEHGVNSSTSPDDRLDDDDLKPNKDEVTFTPAALALINAFLDQLLYSFLSTAKSTNLNVLKPAVIDILKNKLAKDAITSANEELSDLLAGNDEEEDKNDRKDGSDRWDLELVWKRTRLRVMVYMRLGEMEDEDEERHVQEQALHVSGEHSRFSSTAGLVSWSAAIFLTSVLEHVAEQTLQVAGAAAITRLRRSIRNPDDAVDPSQPRVIIVDEQDAERIALNPALGRLWRSWRKTVRANARPATPTQLREIASVISPPKSSSSPRDSFGTAPESAHEDEAAMAERLADHPPDTQYPEHILASNIRLPMGDALRDVDEIEVPGLARNPSDAGSDDGTDTPLVAPERRKSFSNYQSRQSVVQSLAAPPIDDSPDGPPKLKRRRSSSVPTMVRRQKPRPNAALREEAPEDKAAQAVTAPTQSEDDADTLIKDVDNRKSLIDIKTLLAAIDGGFAPFGGKKLDTVEDRPASSESARSFNLNNKAEVPIPSQPIAERQHMDNVQQSPDLTQIGVATTSDEAVAPERMPSAQGTRSTPSPIPNLSRAASIPRSKYSPNSEEEATQAQDVAEPASTAADVSQRDRPILPSEQTLAALRESVHRASSPQMTVVNGVSKNDSSSTVLNRQSIVSAFSNQAQHWEHRQSQQPMPQPQQGSAEPSPQRVSSSTELRKPTSTLTSSSIRSPHDFDQFVRSEEVVKYTLTPESIREAPKADAQALALLTGEVPPVINATQNKDTSDRRSARSQVSKSVTAASTEDLAAAEKKRHRWSITRPLSRNTSAHQKSGLMARDARVVTESTRDFADFIRSTKPDKEPEILPFVTSQSPASLQPHRNSTNYSLPRSSSHNSDRTRSLTRSDIAAGYAPPVPSLPGNGKSLMQPKSAKANDKSGSNELIAFIRDGPKQDGQHRISRTVAPFRNTMDSEHFDEFKTSHPVRPANGIKNDGAGTRGQSIYSQDSTPPSTRASVNSRAPLLNGGAISPGSVAHPAYSGQAQSLNALSSHPPDGSVERKRYRNKDPYAIDVDDDEDVSALPRGNRGGESLAEFLRSSDTARNGEPKPIASAASLAQARELRERARANNVNGDRRNSQYSGPGSTQAGAADINALPLASNGDANAKLPTTGRAGERLGFASSTNTKDLADFLRDSDPAPAPAISRDSQNQASALQKEKKPIVKEKRRGFFSFFRRPSSKSKAARHADMP